MEIDSIAPYSPTTIYGQLTSPLVPKQVTINSHTPYDKVEENDEPEAYSRDYFKGKPQAKIKYELPENENQVELTSKKFPPEFPPEEQNQGIIKEEFQTNKEYTPAEVTSFSVSSISSKDFVNNALKKGYSTDQAVIIQKAQDAYKNSVILTKDPVAALNSKVYVVS